MNVLILKLLSRVTLFSALVLVPGIAPLSIHGGPSDEDVPFVMPFKNPPGPDTWLMAQPYGNTISAYRQRDVIYGRSQGIHFGVDFSARCGTEIVAIADGVVLAVDNLNFGSAPHNLIIDHPELEYASLYGHLLETPSLEVGQEVKQGEVIALSGDPAETCYGRPHLHMEIRDMGHARKYNPLPLMQADWDNLSIVGPFGRGFEYDLDEPRKWQHLDDQPDAVSGGPLLNEFANPWPPDVLSMPSQAIHVGSDRDLTSEPALRQLSDGGCCTQLSWSPDSRQVLFIDKPTPDAPAGTWGISTNPSGSAPELVTDRNGFYSSDRSLLVELNHNSTTIERLEDGARWTVPANGRPVSVSPAKTRIAWQTTNGQDLPIERRVTEIWVAGLDGSNARSVTELPRGGFGGWISEHSLLVSGRESSQSREQVVYALSLTTAEKTELARGERLRGGTLSPDGTWMVYFVALDEDLTQNGLWLVRTDGRERRQLGRDLFGSYQWRDNHRLLIVPFSPEAEAHELVELDVESGEQRALTGPSERSVKVTNNDWAVSPDGHQVAFVASHDHNIWVLTLKD